VKGFSMKKLVMTTVVLVFLTCLSFADPYVNFAGTNGSNSITSPSSYTLSTYATNPTWHLTPETVTFTADGTGSCQPGSCAGRSNNVWETFSTVALATYLTTAPNHVTTTATYYLNGNVVAVTTQIGGPVWHPQAPGFKFNEIELSWASSTNYTFSFQSFDAAPEPSSLILLGSGLLTGVTIFRRRLLA
jgi:hypothetical protein